MKDMRGYVPDHWTLDEALTLIRTLQPTTRKFNYHLCLGGGVLNKGQSAKDLDLFFLPMNNRKESDLSGLHDWLCSLWGDGEKMGRDGEQYVDEDSEYTLMLKFMYSGLRIDVFVIGGVETEVEKKPLPNKAMDYSTTYDVPSAAYFANATNVIWQGIARTTDPFWRAAQQAAPPQHDLDNIQGRIRVLLENIRRGDR